MESTTDIKIWVNLTITLSKRTQNRKKRAWCHFYKIPDVI